MAIDWSATGAMLSGIGGIAAAIAIGAAALVGKRTVDDWREEKLGERRFELAEQILVTAYRCRDELARVRNGALSSQEIEAAVTLLKARGHEIKVGNDDVDRKVFAQGIELRLENAVWSDFDRLRPRALAYFGDAAVKGIQCALEQKRRTWAGALRYFVLQSPDPFANAQALAAFDKNLEELEHLVMAGRIDGRDDEIALAMDDAVRDLESLLLPVLRSRNDT